VRADHAVRHNAAVGLLFGLAVGDVLSQQAALPSAVSAGTIVLPAWGGVAERSFVHAEALMKGEPIDMGVSATDVAASAIALADPDATPPLLGDADAVLMCALVRSGLRGDLQVDPALAAGDAMGEALSSIETSASFCDAVGTTSQAARPLTAAIAGLRWGPGAMPAAWITTVHGSVVGGRTYGLRQLRRLAERLMQQDAPVPPEPRRSLGPREVAPKLWLSNLPAVPRFLADHPDGAVISLCPTTGTFDNHPVRREFALHDAAGSKVNPHLAATVDEVLETIRAFHHEERDVLVHCHHGASRTGLVLRAWLVEELGLDFGDATTEAQVRWPKTSTWNHAFAAEIKRRSSADSPS